MSLKRIAALVVLSILATLIVLPILARKSGTVGAGYRSGRAAARTQASATNATVVATHERFATFLTGGGFQSTLLLENFRPNDPITVKPSLILEEGEIPLDPVHIPPHSSTTVDISAFLLAHGYPDKRGAVCIRYDFKTYGSLTAVAQSVYETHDVYLNSFAQSPEEYWAGTSFDAVLWAPNEDTRGLVSITNTSSEPRIVRTTTLLKDHSEALPVLNIPPRTTRVLHIDDLVEKSHESGAGIHVEFDEYPGDILVEGQLFNERTGFAKYIHFADKALQYPTATLRTHFLLLGAQDPADGFPSQVSFRSVAAIRNIDSTTLNVTPKIRFLKDGTAQTIALRPLALAPGQSRILDLSEEQKIGRLPTDLRHASLQLVPDNELGNIVAELFNFDSKTGGYVVGPNFTSYPNHGTASVWRTDGTFETTVMVENTAAKEDQLSLTLYSGEVAYNKTFPIPAGGLLEINVKDLQQNSVPDKDGRLLSGTSGILSLAGSRNAKSQLTFDKIIHSADQSDYVGLPPNACSYVSGIYRFIDFSAGGLGPFPVTDEYDWSLGGSTFSPTLIR